MTAIPSTRLARRLEPALVWSVWLGMLIVALAAIGRYGPEIPRAEDWLLVPALTGHEPAVGKWLWEQNSEHRAPLPQLAYLALLKLTGGDFRAAMVFDTLALAGLAAAMIVVARRLRGRASYVDGVFPLLFLHLGHWDNLVWSWAIQFVLSTLCAGVVLLLIVVRGTALTPFTAGVAASCLVALPLCGANGLLLVPALGAWFGYVAFDVWSRDAAPGNRMTAVVLLSAVAAASVLVAAYFVGYQRASWYPPNPGIGATLKTAGLFIAAAFGPGVSVARRVFVLGALILIAATTFLLAAKLRRHNGDRDHRALGLVCVIAAIVLLAAGVGWGRAGRVMTSGLSRRYALLAVPMVCAVFFAWELYAPRRWATRMQALLLLMAVILLPANTANGLAARDWVEAGMNAVRRDIETGMPRPLLAERHGPFLLHWDRDRLVAGMRMLGDAGIRPFAGLPDDFVVQEVEAGPVGRAGGAAIDLDGPRRIYAVRVFMSPPTTGGLRVGWRGRDHGSRLELVPRSGLEPSRPGPPTVWINDVIDGLRVECEPPGGLPGLRLVLIGART